MENNYPLVLVFYLDAELMKNPQIIKPFAESIDKMLAFKKANALAFFLPTNGEERVECINPVTVKEEDMEKVNKLIQDIKQNFSIGVEMDLPVDEVVVEDETEGGKPCDCGSNPDGKCKCD
jgi:hypothetical protein